MSQNADLREGEALFILNNTVRNVELEREIVAGTMSYANLVDRSSRVTARARILSLMEQLTLQSKALVLRRVSEAELSSNTALRGAMMLHLDLSSRVAPSAEELAYTASLGRIYIAEHPDLEGFPVGLTLLLPASNLPSGRQSLFSDTAKPWDESEFVVQYGLSTNPGGIGAGRALVELCKKEAGKKRLIAYTPLVGLRARIIQVVDHSQVWEESSRNVCTEDRDLLREQLAELLAWEHLPTQLADPAGQFLKSEALKFAEGASFRLGDFHRHLGARLVGVDFGGDFQESDSMWTRAYLEY